MTLNHCTVRCFNFTIDHRVVKSILKFVHTFFISNTFISNARLKLAKNHVDAKQHPEAENLLFENYSHFSSTLSSKSDRIYSKKQAKEQVCIYSSDYTINHNENERKYEK